MEFLPTNKGLESLSTESSSSLMAFLKHTLNHKLDVVTENLMSAVLQVQ